MFTSLSLTFILSCGQQDTRYQLSENITYFNDAGKGMIRGGNVLLHNTHIYGNVVSYDFDKDFIIAKQRPDKQCFTYSLGANLYTRYTAYAEYISDSNIFEKPSFAPLKGHIEHDSNNYRIFHSRGVSLTNSSNDIQMSKNIADSLINSDPYYQKIFSRQENYWIIDIAKDTLIGPLTENEFAAKRTELGVSKQLKLE